MEERRRVIVIGGGFAGLTAAAELSPSHNVTLVEASGCLGGRVKQAKPFDGCHWLDLGGEFIHGEHTWAMRLAKKHGWGYEDVETNGRICSAYGFIGNKLQPLDKSNGVFTQATDAAERFFEAGRALRRKLKKDVPLCEPLFDTTRSYSDGSVSNVDCMDNDLEQFNQNDRTMDAFVAELEDINDDCKAFLDSFYCQSEGNDISRMGMLEFSRVDDSWKYGERNFRLKPSYRPILDHMIERCKSVKIVLNWQAKQINWKDNLISVLNQRNERLKADHVIIAVPLKILKDGDINFVPQLPIAKRNALENMEMRNGCKMFCCFSRMFWPDSFSVVYDSCNGPFKQIWVESKYFVDGNYRFILCGFTTGTSADVAARMDQRVLIMKFLDQLDRIFRSEADLKPASGSFIDHYFYDWGSNPFVKGCYASPVVGSYAAVEKLAESVANKIFFAGEATNSSSMSTIQSAIDSGVRAAHEIVDAVRLEDSS